MTTLSSLPTELLQEVSSYLAPFDQMALSATSKSFYSTIKPHEPLDQISKCIFLSSSLPTTAFSTSDFVNHPQEVFDLLSKTYCRIFSPSPVGHAQRLRLYFSQSLHKELIEPYFTHKEFPQCTIADHYFSALKIVAERIYEYAWEHVLKELLHWICVRDHAVTLMRCSREIIAMMDYD